MFVPALMLGLALASSGQDGCLYPLVPTEAYVLASGETFNVSATPSPGCPFAASSNVDWIHVQPVEAEWRVIVTVAANPGRIRAATIMIGGRSFPVRQQGLPLSTAGDFDGDGIADLGVFRPETGTWHVDGQPDVQWGLAGDVPVPGDYAGTGAVVPAVFRPSTSQWFIQGREPVTFGLPGDIPVPGFGYYGGRAETNIAVFRPSDGRWYRYNEKYPCFPEDPVCPSTWFVANLRGAPGDVPVPADYDGDGVAEPAIYRDGVWIAQAWGAEAPRFNVHWGVPGDIPVPGDFDGDHFADLAVFRPWEGRWYVLLSTHSTLFPTYLPFIVTWGLPGDVPSALDVNGDGADELVVYRPSNGTYYVYDVSTATGYAQPSGWPGDLPLSGRMPPNSRAATDADGDGTADLIVFRPADGTWHMQMAATGATSALAWGLPGDVPVSGDYDGDGRLDPTVYRPSNGTWYTRLSAAGYGLTREVQWGFGDDRPVPADYDGDGHTDIAVFRPSTAEWFIEQSSTNNSTFVTIAWGTPGDTPMPGDYDGDGLTDLAVYRPADGVWSVRLSSGWANGVVTQQWGLPGDLPIAADFNGDGLTDIAVYRPSDGNWYILDRVHRTWRVLQWGLAGDVPVQRDYDADGFDDIAVYRPSEGTWYIVQSSTGMFVIRHWGMTGDIPIR